MLLCVELDRAKPCEVRHKGLPIEFRATDSVQPYARRWKSYNPYGCHHIYDHVAKFQGIAFPNFSERRAKLKTMAWKNWREPNALKPMRMLQTSNTQKRLVIKTEQKIGHHARPRRVSATAPLHTGADT